MVLYAYDIFSGSIADSLEVIGSRDMTLVERYQRLGDFSQRSLGLPESLMQGWSEAVERLIMHPPEELSRVSEAVAMLMILRDAGQRRFRFITEGRQDDYLKPIFEHLGHDSFCHDFIHSSVSYFSPIDRIDWGYLDVNQTEALLENAMGSVNFKEAKTAVIAGRLSNMSRHDAEQALNSVGIETQNSISHNIDYLILGSKGTGGTKQDKAHMLNDKGRKITILDEEGFEALIKSPKRPPESWSLEFKDTFENFVRALRHIWSSEEDLYCLSFEYDPEEDIL